MGINHYIAKQFQKPSGIGGKWVASVMNRQNRLLYEETLRLLAPQSGDRLLDIGCGNGYVLGMLAERCDCVCAGIDISETMIKTAQRRNRSVIKRGGMSFMCRAAGDMPFGDGAFDKAYSIHTAYFRVNLLGDMKEIRRVIRPGGLFIDTLFTNDTLGRLPHTRFGYALYPPDQLRKSAVLSGFEPEIVPLLNGAAYALVCRAV